jgi:TonB family protein
MTRSTTSFIVALIGHGAVLALLVVLAGQRGCTRTFPEPLGGFTVVELGPLAEAAPTPSAPDAPPPPPPGPKVPPAPPPPPTPDAIRLPEPEKPPPKPVKPPEPVKVPEKKPDPPPKVPVKKPEPPKTPPKPPPKAPPPRDLAKELRERLQKPPTTPSGRTFSPVGPSVTRGRPDGVPDGSAAVAQVEDELYRKLHAAWDQPRGVSSLLSTDVFLKVASSGRIVEFRLVKPSGDPVMDQSVLAAVRATGAVAPLPRALSGGYETTFRFRVQN